ncbi:uncharacterized protein PG998_012274 [Apiospora kogelbergensis]|uniref:Uncharacterized protein n=1 Tax=Apiospora kogelbergensis TaxID=1337665 RepID=A0AAW0QT14_9PEZI
MTFQDPVAWHKRMTRTSLWWRSMELRLSLVDDEGLQWNGISKGVTNSQGCEAMIKAEQKTGHLG